MRLALIAAGTTQITNKELETAVHKLGFTCTGVMAAGEAQPTRPDIDSMLEEILGNAKITITKQDGYSSETLIPAILLRDLAETSAFNEGVIFIERNYDAAVAGNNTVTIEFSVEITRAGALRLNDNAKLMFHLEDKPSAMVFDIEAIDSNENTQTFIAYETKFVNANVQKDFMVTGHHAVALPVDDIVTVELSYNSGKVVKLTKSEVKKLLRDNVDEIVVCNGLNTYGYNKWAVLDITQCHMINVTLGSSTNFYLIKEAKA